jgi:hypothetical protein
MKLIDSIQRPARRPAAQASSQPQRPAATGARFTSVPAKRRRLHVAWLSGWGLGIVLLYGILALLLRVPSRYTWTLALMALLYMVGTRFAAYNDLAQALAVLVYVLLAIGVISLAVELKSARRVWFKKH